MDPRWEEVSLNHGYKVKEMLGEGSFGQVYRAQNMDNGEHYAIKLIQTPFKDQYQAR